MAEYKDINYPAEGTKANLGKAIENIETTATEVKDKELTTEEMPLGQALKIMQDYFAGNSDNISPSKYKDINYPAEGTKATLGKAIENIETTATEVKDKELTTEEMTLGQARKIMQDYFAGNSDNISPSKLREAKDALDLDIEMQISGKSDLINRAGRGLKDTMLLSAPTYTSLPQQNLDIMAKMSKTENKALLDEYKMLMAQTKPKYDPLSEDPNINTALVTMGTQLVSNILGGVTGRAEAGAMAAVEVGRMGAEAMLEEQKAIKAKNAEMYKAYQTSLKAYNKGYTDIYKKAFDNAYKIDSKLMDKYVNLVDKELQANINKYKALTDRDFKEGKLTLDQAKAVESAYDDIAKHMVSRLNASERAQMQKENNFFKNAGTIAKLLNPVAGTPTANGTGGSGYTASIVYDVLQDPKNLNKAVQSRNNPTNSVNAIVSLPSGISKKDGTTIFSNVTIKDYLNKEIEEYTKASPDKKSQKLSELLSKSQNLLNVINLSNSYDPYSKQAIEANIQTFLDGIVKSSAKSEVSPATKEAIKVAGKMAAKGKDEKDIKAAVEQYKQAFK